MSELKEGLVHISTSIVKAEHLATKVGSGDMEVFATPAMIALMENAAMMCVLEHIDESSSTVGISISTTHIRATAINSDVEAVATVTKIDGKKITFSIIARDGQGVIGEATHERYIVDREKFLSRL